MEKKKKIMAIVAAVVLLLVASVGLSFAYFTANLSGGETGETIVVSGGTLNIVYADHNPNIEVSDIIPQSEPVAIKTFTVTGNNTTDLTMPYYLSLVVDANGFSNNAITYTLTSTNTSSNGTPASNISDHQGIKIGSRNYALGNGSFVNGLGKVHTYELKIYFLDTGVNQNINQGKSFKAHVAIAGETSSGGSVIASGNLSTMEACDYYSEEAKSDGGYVVACPSSSNGEIIYTLDGNGLLEISGTGEIRDPLAFNILAQYLTEEEKEIFYMGAGSGLFANLAQFLVMLHNPDLLGPMIAEDLSGSSYEELAEMIVMGVEGPTGDQRDSILAITDKLKGNLPVIKEVRISEGITSIGYGALFGLKVTDPIILPSSIEVLQFGAMSSISASVVLNDGLTKIKGWSFAYSLIDEIYIPNSVTEIEAEAFADSSIKTINLGHANDNELTLSSEWLSRSGSPTINWGVTR